MLSFLQPPVLYPVPCPHRKPSYGLLPQPTENRQPPQTLKILCLDAVSTWTGDEQEACPPDMWCCQPGTETITARPHPETPRGPHCLILTPPITHTCAQTLPACRVLSDLGRRSQQCLGFKGTGGSSSIWVRLERERSGMAGVTEGWQREARNSCPREAGRWQELGLHVSRRSKTGACSVVQGTSRTKNKFKNKIIKNFKTALNPKQGTFLRMGLVEMHKSLEVNPAYRVCKLKTKQNEAS